MRAGSPTRSLSLLFKASFYLCWLPKLSLILLSRVVFSPAKGFSPLNRPEQTIGLAFLPDFSSLLLGSAAPSDGIGGRSGGNLGLKLVAHAATMGAASTT